MATWATGGDITARQLFSVRFHGSIWLEVMLENQAVGRRVGDSRLTSYA